METPLNIAYDCDDVTFPLMQLLQEFHNKNFGTTLAFHEINTFELDQLWNCSRDEAIRRVGLFYETEPYLVRKPVDGAVEVVSRFHQAGIQQEIITSTHAPALGNVTNAFANYFPGIFPRERVHLTGAHDNDGHKRTKLEICKTIGAEVLVDDYVGNFQGIKQTNVTGFLFRHYWNMEYSDEQLSSLGIKPVEGWLQFEDEVGQLVMARQRGDLMWTR